MSSVASEFKCWFCPQTFRTNRDLKNHAASSEHKVLRVICPWCYDEEKTYRRICELQKHTDKRHPSLVDDLKEGEFFSEANGFWLGIFPEGYRKIIKPTEFESTLAMKTRAAVSRWLYRVKGPTRTKDQWEQGWQLGRSRPPVPPQSHKTTDRQETCYSPTRPSLIDNLSLSSISLTPAGNLAYLTSNNQDMWYRVQLIDNVFDDRRAADNLLRRMRSCLGNKQTIPSEFSTEIKDKEITRSIAKELGIAEGLIRNISRQSIKFTAVPSKKRKVEEPEIEIHADGEIESMDDDTYDQNKNNCQTPSNQPNAATNTQEEEPLEPQSSDLPIPSEGNETRPQEAEQEREEAVDRQPQQEKKTLRDRAKDLLFHGVMPLLPPARREWNGVESIELSGQPFPILWPPVNWQELTGEDKLTAWMSTAMALEYQRGICTTTNRGQLLDRYAMLALPGTAVEKGEHNTTTSLRLLNYNLLKNIFLGRVKDEEANLWLKVLEAAREGADKSAEGFLDKIKDVPLRLTESDVGSSQ